MSTGHHHQLGKFWNCHQEQPILIMPLDIHTVLTHEFPFKMSEL